MDCNCSREDEYNKNKRKSEEEEEERKRKKKEEEEEKKDNYILCEYNINNEDLNKDTQILNYLNEEMKEMIINYYKEIGKAEYILEINKDEINSSICDLYLNNERINFSYKYKFEKKGKYSLKIIFKKSIKNKSFKFL